VTHLLLDYRPALRDRTGVGEWVHQLAISLLALRSAGDPAAAGLDLTLWSSSWRDRPTPVALRELNGARFVDRRVPVRPLTWAWNRVGWPPIEALTSQRFDIVHSTAPLLLPARSGLRVCTVYDLDFLAHPDRTHGEMRRDFPKLVHAHAARADLVVRHLGVLETPDRGAPPGGPPIGLPCAGPAYHPGLPDPCPRGRQARPATCSSSARSSRAKTSPPCWRLTGSCAERQPSLPRLVLAGTGHPGGGCVGGRGPGPAAQGARRRRRLRVRPASS